MHTAVTNRTGNDNSALVLRGRLAATCLSPSSIGRLTFELIIPALGAVVQAIGPDGWTYIGPVISQDTAAGTYTILPVASNRIQDNVRAWHMNQQETTCATIP